MCQWRCSPSWLPRILYIKGISSACRRDYPHGLGCRVCACTDHLWTIIASWYKIYIIFTLSNSISCTYQICITYVLFASDNFLLWWSASKSRKMWSRFADSQKLKYLAETYMYSYGKFFYFICTFVISSYIIIRNVCTIPAEASIYEITHGSG